MSHRLLFAMPGRRIVAAAATIAIAALALVWSSPAARADTEDSYVSVSPVAMTLSYDANGNGRPDLGDKVTLSMTVTAKGSDIRTSAVYPGSNFLPDLAVVNVAAGASQTVAVEHTVNVLDLGTLGTGPTFGTVTLAYWKGLSRKTIELPGPAPLYVAGDPLSVVTTFDLTENGGSVPGQVVQGDSVAFATTVTNVSGYAVRVTSMPGFDDFPGSTRLLPGESLTVHHAAQTVTLADMQAGSVTFPSSAVTWTGGYIDVLAYIWNGTQTVSFAPVPTEPIDASVTADVTTALHTAGGADVALGSATAGDVIDFTFALTNTGNVTADYVSLATGPSWPDVVSAMTYARENSGVPAGASLPAGVWAAADITSEGASAFMPYTLTATDVANGYVDLDWQIKAAPTKAIFDGDPGAYTYDVSHRVFLKDFLSKGNLAFTKALLNDANGDGIGQAGETIDYRVRFKNNSDQPLTIGTADATGASDVPAPLAAKFNGTTLLPGETVAKAWTYTITAADVTRTSVSAQVSLDYTGDIDGAHKNRTATADVIPTGEYVAPASTLDTAATYVDTNGDGHPSIGETVTVTVTVANSGGYPLTGLVVADAAGSDVTGLLPSFSGTIAGGTQEQQQFTYVLTAADFARGSLVYSTEMTADGLATTASATSVNLTDITFAADPTDLDGVLPGGITVCLANGSPSSTIVISETISVFPGGACVYGGLPDGYHVVAFSTPMVLGTGTFSVTVPGAIGVGAHRIALYAPDGTLVGYQNVTVKDPIAFSGPDGGTLAYTGTDRATVTGMAGGAAALVLLGTGALVAATRPRKRV